MYLIKPYTQEQYEKLKDTLTNIDADIFLNFAFAPLELSVIEEVIKFYNHILYEYWIDLHAQCNNSILKRISNKGKIGEINFKRSKISSIISNLTYFDEDNEESSDILLIQSQELVDLNMLFTDITELINYYTKLFNTTRDPRLLTFYNSLSLDDLNLTNTIIFLIRKKLDVTFEFSFQILESYEKERFNKDELNVARDNYINVNTEFFNYTFLEDESYIERMKKILKALEAITPYLIDKYKVGECLRIKH